MSQETTTSGITILVGATRTNLSVTYGRQEALSPSAWSSATPKLSAIVA